MVDHAKLPNLVIVAVVGFFWRKMKAFRPLEGRCCDEIQFEFIHLVNYYGRKPSFTLKIVQNPLLRTPDVMVEVFDGVVVKKTSNVCWNLPWEMV